VRPSFVTLIAFFGKSVRISRRRRRCFSSFLERMTHWLTERGAVQPSRGREKTRCGAEGTPPAFPMTHVRARLGHRKGCPTVRGGEEHTMMDANFA